MTRVHTSGPRLTRRLIRERVRALTIQFERDPVAMCLAEDGDHADTEPHALGPLLCAALEHAGQTGGYTKMARRLHALSRWALRHDPGLEVSVEFAVSYLLDTFSMQALLGDDAANVFLSGMPRTAGNPGSGDPLEDPNSRSTTAYTRADLERLSLLPEAVSQWFSAADRTCLQSTWRPAVGTRGHMCDPIRPPPEALAVVALHAASGSPKAIAAMSPTGLQRPERVLAIGLGHTAGAQALSAMLPGTWVYADATPYHSQLVEPGPWDVIVLNIALASATELATALGAGGTGSEPTVLGFRELRSRASRNLDPGIVHIPALLAGLTKHTYQGCPLVVLADPRLNSVVQPALNDRGFERTDINLGTRRAAAIYVGCGVPTEGTRAGRGARGLPQGTGRVISAWVCP